MNAFFSPFYLIAKNGSAVSDKGNAANLDFRVNGTNSYKPFMILYGFMRGFLIINSVERLEKK